MTSSASNFLHHLLGLGRHLLRLVGAGLRFGGEVDDVGVAVAVVVDGDDLADDVGRAPPSTFSASADRANMASALAGSLTRPCIT